MCCVASIAVCESAEAHNAAVGVVLCRQKFLDAILAESKVELYLPKVGVIPTSRFLGCTPSSASSCLLCHAVNHLHHMYA
jgi:hypothetical protein